MDPTWLDDTGTFLGPRSPLPLDAPFTAKQAYGLGLSRRDFTFALECGLLRRVLRGVYCVSQAPEDTLMRTSALTLVVPPTAVVVDRTAAWLHGVDILPRSALTEPPPLDVIHVDDTRVRRPEVNGRRRGLIPSDVTVVHGVPVTTALRTALDLGRMLWRFDALAAIDAFLRLGVPHELLSAEIGRFRGYRGVRQLRVLAPLGDSRAESIAESALRLHWIDAGLPEPELQFWIYADSGVPRFRLDIADPNVRYAAEYDGEEFHSQIEDQEYDEARQEWISANRSWTIDRFTKRDVYERDADPIPRLQAGYAAARRSISLWTPRRRTA
jgi:very-short-patch-repair endonuclease